MNWNFNILLSSLPTNNVNPKIMEVVSLCRSTLDANSPSPRSQIPSLTQKGYAIYKSTTTFCALCILSCNLGLVHFWAIWLAKLDNIILTVFCEYIYLVPNSWILWILCLLTWFLSSDQWSVEGAQCRWLWKLQRLVQKQPNLSD